MSRFRIRVHSPVSVPPYVEILLDGSRLMHEWLDDDAGSGPAGLLADFGLDTVDRQFASLVRLLRASRALEKSA